MQVLDPGDATPSQAQRAFEVEQRIKHNIGQLRTVWILIAEDLYEFNKLQMWRDLGHVSFDEWCAGPDVDLSRRMVFNLIQIWRELVVGRGIKPKQLANVPTSKVTDILAAVRRGFVDPEDALADCRTLGRDDLRERYKLLSTPAGAREDGAGTLPAFPEPPAESKESAAAALSLESPPLGGSGGFAAEKEPEYAICHACGSRYKVTTT